MTTKTKSLNDRLAAVESATKREYDDAGERFWRIAVAEATGTAASAEDLDRLPRILEVLDATPDRLREQVERLRRLHEFTGDAPDELAAFVAAERRAKEASAGLRKLKTELAAVDVERLDAQLLVALARDLRQCRRETLRQLGDREDLASARQRRQAGNDRAVQLKRAIEAAERTCEAAHGEVRQALQQLDRSIGGARRLAEESARNLLAAGCPRELIPSLPVEVEAPVRRVRVRALERCFIEGRLREPGAVFSARESEIGGPVVLATSDEQPQPKPEYGRSRKPEWSTPGWMQQHDAEQDQEVAG